MMKRGFVFAAAMSIAACGGGSGGSGSGVAAFDDVDGAAAILADGRVGDSAFYDDGQTRDGFADGSQLSQTGQTIGVIWEPVTEQLGGEAAELAGYRLYFGTRPGQYEYVVEIPDPAASYASVNLPTGTYYFVATAVDAVNREGPPSIPVSLHVI